MLAGLIFQVVSLGLFAACCADFARRVRNNKSNWNVKYIDLVNSGLFKAFLAGLFVASVTIFVRSVYRCVELAGGFNGKLFTSDEALFMVLEGVMIVLATACLTALHPAVAFQGAWDAANFKFRAVKGGESKRLSGSDEESQRGVEMEQGFLRK